MTRDQALALFDFIDRAPKGQVITTLLFADGSILLPKDICEQQGIKNHDQIQIMVDSLGDEVKIVYSLADSATWPAWLGIGSDYTRIIVSTDPNQ